MERPRRVSLGTTHDAAHAGRVKVMMPHMRQRHGLALDADGNDRVPALVDLDRRPAKKGRKTKGSTKRSPGSKAARGHAARDSGDADAEMRWGAELVLQLALGGEVPPSASRDALAPPGKAPKGRLDDPNKRRGGDPSGAYSEPLGARSHVLVGDPIVVPSRRAASEGDLAQGPVDSRVARGAGHDASAFGLPTGPHLVKEDRDEASNVFASVAPAASQHAPLPPLRLAARAALPQSSVQAPDQTRAGAKRGGDDNSLCARILAARAEAVAATASAATGRSRPVGSRKSTQTVPTAPSSALPALLEAFAQASRVLQNAAVELVRAHDEGDGCASARGSPRRKSRFEAAQTSLADPASLLAAARAILQQAARGKNDAPRTPRPAVRSAALASDPAAAGDLDGARARGSALDETGNASAPAMPSVVHPEPPGMFRARVGIERDPDLAPALARAMVAARDTARVPPPEIVTARGSPAAGAAAAPPAGGRSAFKRGRSSSAFRGVTLHRRTKRWESHIWVRETGKQLYLGGFDHEHAAAEAHDLCALKLRGRSARGLNFPLERYAAAAPALDAASHEQVVAAVRAGRLTARGGFATLGRANAA